MQPIRKEPSQTENAYRHRARKLAAQIGCTVEIERMGHYNNIWVFGPREVYGRDIVDRDIHREDPREGSHICFGWAAVHSALHDYRRDLHFHWLGIDAATTDRIVTESPYELREHWLDTGDVLTGLVLADWFEEHGKDDLATSIRKATGQPLTPPRI